MSSEGYRLNADEVACVKRLAELYERGHTRVSAGPLPDALGLPAEKREAILGTMDNLGLIRNPAHTRGGRYLAFLIDAKALQVARAIQEQEAKKEEPEDIVEQVKTTVRRNRILAWALIAFFVLVGLSSVVNLINGLFELLKKFGVFK